MAENIPNIPTGAVPPKKETGKVQPKKETVRINLPPKPSAAPTIKLPTLPPGGPTGAATVAPGLAAAAPAAHHTPAAAPAVPRTSAAAPVAPRATAAPQQQRPAAAHAAAPTISTLDTVLAIIAAVVVLASAGMTAWIAFML
jgi:hypothetical protein